MDALNLLKFWRYDNMAATSNSFPHLVVETDTESDEEDSFFDLELTVHGFDNKENNINNKTEHDPQDKTMRETKASLCSKHALTKTSKSADANTEVDVPQKTTLSLSPNEPISKRKVLPIEPISKPQSPIALLKSAPSFRIFMFRKHKKNRTVPTQKTQKKETKVFAMKLNIEELSHCTPTLSRDNSTRSYGSKVLNHGSEETKPERFSKDVLQKYLKLIKPLYVKVSKRYSEKVKFSGESNTASPLSSPSVGSVSLKKEKQGSFQAGIRVVSKHLGKSRSTSTVAGSASPAKRSDDTLLQQHDGIQSAILHCKRSFNSRDSSMSLSAEGSMHSLRNSFEDEHGENV